MLKNFCHSDFSSLFQTLVTLLLQLALGENQMYTGVQLVLSYESTHVKENHYQYLQFKNMFQSNDKSHCKGDVLLSNKLLREYIFAILQILGISTKKENKIKSNSLSTVNSLKQKSSPVVN